MAAFGMPCTQLHSMQDVRRFAAIDNRSVKRESDQNSSGASLKRSRARQSCTRCRTQKLKCSGEVPCARCVIRKEEASCKLWHRGTGRPKSTKTPDTLEACAYYSHVLQKISPDLKEEGKPAPDLLVQLARLWLMVAVYQKGADIEFAKEEISRSTKIPLTSIILSPKVNSFHLCPLLALHVPPATPAWLFLTRPRRLNQGHLRIASLRSS